MMDDDYDHRISSSSYKHRTHDISANIPSTLEPPTRSRRPDSYFDYNAQPSSGRSRRSGGSYFDHGTPHHRSRRIYTEEPLVKQRYEGNYRDDYGYGGSRNDLEQPRHYVQRKPVRAPRWSTEFYDRYSDEDQPSVRREPPHPTASRSTTDYRSSRAAEHPFREQRRRSSTTELARMPHIRESERYPKPSHKAQGTRHSSGVRDRARRPVADADFDSEDSNDSSLDGYSKSPPVRQSPSSSAKPSPAIESALQLSILPQNYEKQTSVRNNEGAKSRPAFVSRKVVGSNTNNDTSHTISEHSSYRTSSSAAESSDNVRNRFKGRPRFPEFFRSLSFGTPTSPASPASPGSLHLSDGSMASPNPEKRRPLLSSLIPATASFTKIDSTSETSSISSRSTASIPASLSATTHTIMTQDDLRHDPEAHTLTTLSKIWCFRELNSPDPEWTAFDIRNQKLLTAHMEKVASSKAGTIDDEVKFNDSHIFDKRKKVRIFPDKKCGCYTGNTRDETIVLQVEYLEVSDDTTFVYKNKEAK